MDYLNKIGLQRFWLLLKEKFIPNDTVKKIEIVDELPSTEEEGVLYLVKQKQDTNLYNPATAPTVTNVRIDTTTNTIESGTKQNTITYLQIEPNATYKVTKTSGEHFSLGTSVDVPALNVSLTNSNANDYATEATITSGATDNYLIIYYYNTDETVTEEELRNSIVVKKV